METDAVMERRAADERINQLCVDVATLQRQMIENTAVTTQIRDILRSFKIMAAVAKWITVIGAGVAVIIHGFDWLRKF